MYRPKSFGFWFLEYSETRNRDSDMSLSEFHHGHELYYNPKKKFWGLYDDVKYDLTCFPAGCKCHSLKAAKRHLRKHQEIPKGTWFRLVSKYVGCDVWIRK